MDEMRFAVCDDNQYVIADIEQAILSAGKRFKVDCIVSTFDTGEALLDALKTGDLYDIFILDIVLPGINGIELGLQIRNDYGFSEALIYFTSDYDEYHGKLYQVRVHDFITKPIQAEILESQLKDAFDRFIQRRAVITIKKDYSQIVIKKSSILYLESKLRNIELVYKAGDRYENIVYTGSIKKELERLRPPDFCQPHASFIVNLNNATSFQKSQIIMDNGKTIKISYSKSKETQQAISRFILDQTWR